MRFAKEKAEVQKHCPISEFLTLLHPNYIAFYTGILNLNEYRHLFGHRDIFPGARQFVHTAFRTHGISYTRHFVHTTFRTKTKTRHFVQKPKPDISYKNETRHFVQKRNPTFRTKTKPDISYKNETRHFVQFILYNLLL